MKKITLIFSMAIALAYSASAQFSRGTIFVGPTIGTSSYQSASDNLTYTGGNNSNRASTYKTYTLTAGPQVGTFLTDHLVLGALLNYGLTARNTHTNTILTNNNELTTNAKTTTSTFSTGPFLRYYYFNNLSKNIFYTQLSGTLGTGSGNSSGNGNNTVNSTYQSNGAITGIFVWNAGASVGLTHFFNNTIGMDIALGYGYNSYTSNDKSTVNTTSNTTEIVTSTSDNYKEALRTQGVTLGLGFHWFLKK